MAGSGLRFTLPIQFAVDAAGVPLAGASLFFYETGTDTPQNTYADSGLSIANPNPVIADSAGRFGNIFLLGSPSYKVVLNDADGVQQWSADPVGPSIANAGMAPVGMVTDFAGATAPAGWLLCYGQAISRTTYSALFGAIGTTWGSGDGSTTFDLPDLRGRAGFGKDDMGAVAASRLTSAGSGVNGASLGAVGGDQIMQGHTHTVTDPGHVHTVTDPGHTHTFQAGSTTAGTLNAPDQVSHGPPFYTFTGPIANSNTTGVTVDSATTALTVDTAGSGASQNVPPAAVFNKIIYTGVGG